MTTYYDVLGVKWNASYEEIKEAYRRQLRKYHPDTTGMDEREAVERLQMVLKAYKVLRDPVQRSTYNLKMGLVFSKQYYDREWSEKVNNATRNMKQFAQRIVGDRVDWDAIDWKIIFAVLATPMFIYYSFRMWVSLLMLVSIAYTFYWVICQRKNRC